MPHYQFVKQKFEDAKSYPYYQQMQDMGTQVVGIWDDHDYGLDDGGAEFMHKDVMRGFYLDFIGEPKDSPRSLDKHSPIHQDYLIESGSNFQTHVILLDNRYDYNKKEQDR